VQKKKKKGGGPGKGVKRFVQLLVVGERRGSGPKKKNEGPQKTIGCKKKTLSIETTPTETRKERKRKGTGGTILTKQGRHLNQPPIKRHTQEQGERKKKLGNPGEARVGPCQKTADKRVGGSEKKKKLGRIIARSALQNGEEKKISKKRGTKRRNGTCEQGTKRPWPTGTDLWVLEHKQTVVHATR